MMSFDKVLPELLRTCENHEASRGGVARYCVVRDVRGRVRLVVKPADGQSPDLQALQALLTDRGSASRP